VKGEDPMSQPQNPRNPNATKLVSPLASSGGQRQQQTKKQPLQKAASASKSKKLGSTQNRNAPQSKK